MTSEVDGTVIKQATEFVTLDDEIKLLEKRVKQLKARKSQIEEPLLDHMMELGVDSLRLTERDTDALANTLSDTQRLLAHDIAHIVQGFTAENATDDNPQFQFLTTEEAIDALDAVRSNLFHGEATRRRTLYTYKIWWAKIERDEQTGEPLTEKVIAALRKAGLDELIKESYSSQTLSAYIRELERNQIGEPILPSEFDGAIGATEQISLRTKKS